jgi:hypothetical protein
MGDGKEGIFQRQLLATFGMLFLTELQAASQTTYFEEFHENHERGDSESTALDDRRELKLVLEVADIVDELKMIRHLLEKQREVLRFLISALVKFHPSKDNFIPETQNYNVTFGEIRMDGQHNSVGVFSTVAKNDNVNDLENTKKLAQQIAQEAREDVISADELLVFLLSETDGIRVDAEYTHKMVNFTV